MALSRLLNSSVLAIIINNGCSLRRVIYIIYPITMKNIQVVNHPWQFLWKELKARWMTQLQFADLIEITPAEVSRIISWKKNITPRIANRIEAALGTSASVWIWWQSDYDLYVSQTNKAENNIIMQIQQRVWNLAYA